MRMEKFPCNVSIPRELRVKAALMNVNISAVATAALRTEIRIRERAARRAEREALAAAGEQS